MDPFHRLPWFILRDILYHLPDLPTLHRLHNASPAVAAFLHQDSCFPGVVETIISHPRHDKGFLRQIQFFLRTVVFIWWRTYSSHSNPDSDEGDNPLPASYEIVLNYFRKSGFSSPEGNMFTLGYGDGPLPPLPRSTPPAVLCRLLALSTRLRQITHGCFHGMVARCMALKPEHPEDPHSSYWLQNNRGVDPFSRPPGRPYTPIDIGPPSCVEEQRLMKAMLRIVLFFELRNAVVTRGLFSMGEKEIQSWQKDQVGDFWARTRPDHDELQQMRTMLMWLGQEAGGAEAIESWIISSSLLENLTYCCPELTPLTTVQWDWSETQMVCYVFGIQSYRTCSIDQRCPTHVDLAIFRPFGFSFWDMKRMKALGLMPGTEEGKSWVHKHNWFAWSSILTEDQREEILKRQHGNCRV